MVPSKGIVFHRPKWNQLQQLGTLDHFRSDENKEHPKHCAGWMRLYDQATCFLPCAKQWAITAINVALLGP